MAEYDVTLERFDVAVRALVWLARRGQPGRLEELGLDPWLVDWLRDEARPSTERAVFALLKREPALVEQMLEVLRRYQEVAAVERHLCYADPEAYALLVRMREGREALRQLQQADALAHAESLEQLREDEQYAGEEQD